VFCSYSSFFIGRNRNDWLLQAWFHVPFCDNWQHEIFACSNDWLLTNISLSIKKFWVLAMSKCLSGGNVKLYREFSGFSDNSTLVSVLQNYRQAFLHDMPRLP
jgi:hypothetical protein